MKHCIQSSLVTVILLGWTQLGFGAANAPAGYVDFGKLSPGGSGSEFVEVNINSNIVAMVSRLAGKAQPDVSKLLQGLHSIRVNVIGLTDENRDEVQNRVKDIRAQLDTQGWERVVTVQEKKQDVGVFLKTRGGEAVEGVVVTVLDGKKEAVLINIVGDIKPEELGAIGERFNIDPLKKLGKKSQSKKAEEE
jgi:hypothetical protein